MKPIPMPSRAGRAKRFYAFILTILLTLPTMAEPADTFAIAIRERIDTLMKSEIFERSNVGLYVYDLTADTALYEYAKRQTLRPASTMKVMTASAALHTLGTDYNFQTRLYISALTDLRPASDDPALADSITALPPAFSARVAVKGGMDPLLGPDDLRAFAQALRDRNITVIEGNIVCDASLKDTTRMGWGWCWDDPYVPLTPFLCLGKASTFESNLRKALRNAEITFNGALVDGRVPSDAQLAITRTHSIDQILQPMMKKSNNLYAECLFYQLAARSGKAYASSKDAAARVGQLIKRVGHQPEHYEVADGSGLSLYNYLSAELLVDVLRYDFRNDEVYSHLLASLPIMGRDGTLRKRCIGTSAQDRVRAKTGTVRGVSSLAGYATAPNGHVLAFAIINQGIVNGSTGRRFQDRVCCALTQPLGLSTIEPDELPEADLCEDEEAEEKVENPTPSPADNAAAQPQDAAAQPQDAAAQPSANAASPESASAQTGAANTAIGAANTAAGAATASAGAVASSSNTEAQQNEGKTSSAEADASTSKKRGLNLGFLKKKH